MANVDFWFELASPYSYLSAMRIDDEAEARGVTVRWRPFLLGPIFAAQGWDTSPFRIYPAKGRYMWHDVERRCVLKGVPFRAPSEGLLASFPLNTVAAARLATVGLDHDWGKAFVKAVYRTEYVDHRDISDPAILAELLKDAGADPKAALAASQDPENKPKLRHNTESAVELGLFGAPSFTIGSELFWGDDRLKDALNWAKDAEPRQNRASGS